MWSGKITNQSRDLFRAHSCEVAELTVGQGLDGRQFQSGCIKQRDQAMDSWEFVNS